MAKTTCSVATCERTAAGQGACWEHRLSREGHCEWDGCTAPIKCRRLCVNHYATYRYRRDRAAKPAVIGTCGHCEGQFEQPKDRRALTYCTERCRGHASAARQKAARQAVRPVTECSWCGADIRHMRADAKFCSDVCSNRCDYRDNRARVDAAAKRYVAENPEKILAATRRYREENRQQIYDRQKRWQDENSEHHRNYQRMYQKRYALENPEKARLHAANRYAWKRSNGGGALKVTERDWSRMLHIYRHRCAYCGGGAGEVLEIEHVVPLSRGGRHSIGNIVPACMRCNRTKNSRLLVEWRNNIPRRVRRRVIAV